MDTDLLEGLLRPIWAWNKLGPAPASSLEALRAQGAPEAIVRFYAMGNGGGSEGISFLPASQVRRGHGDVDARSVRGLLVFADNGRAHHKREVYGVDVSGFFGLGPGVIVRGVVPVKWGFAKLVASDAVAMFEAIRATKLRARSIPKRARAELQKALKKHARHVVAVPGPVADPYSKKSRDPDRVSYNFRNDGRTQLPWALSHLYYVIDGLELARSGLIIRPFMELERTPAAWADDARGYVFAARGSSTFAVTSASMQLPEGLVAQVDDGDPSTVRILGHLVDVVSRWVRAELVDGVPRSEWTLRHGR